MAVLSDADRAAIAAEYMREIGVDRVGCPVVKATVRAVVNSADDWRNTNAVSYGTAINAAGGTSLSAKEKARLLLRVVEKFFKIS
mgnify:CR=1 FL=1